MLLDSILQSTLSRAIMYPNHQCTAAIPAVPLLNTIVAKDEYKGFYGLFNYTAAKSIT